MIEHTGPIVDPRRGLRIAAMDDAREARMQHRSVSAWLRERAELPALDDEEPKT